MGRKLFAVGLLTFALSAYGYVHHFREVTRYSEIDAINYRLTDYTHVKNQLDSLKTVGFRGTELIDHPELVRDFERKYKLAADRMANLETPDLKQDIKQCEELYDKQYNSVLKLFYFMPPSMLGAGLTATNFPKKKKSKK